MPAPQAPLTEGPAPGDCLRAVEFKRLSRAIKRCDAVVKAHPQDPQPRNDRSLLHSLAGRTPLACRDSQEAARLLAALPARATADPMLTEEIKLRQQSCRQLTSRSTADAPSAATPAAPPQPSGG